MKIPQTNPESNPSLDLSGYTQVTDPSQLSDGADTIVVLQGVSEVGDGALLVHGVTDSLGIPTRCMGLGPHATAVPLAVVYQRPVQWLTGDPGDEQSEARFGAAEVFTMSFSFDTAMLYCGRGHWADRRAWGDTKRVVADGGTVVYPDGRSGAYSPTKGDRAARDWRVGHWLEKERR